MSTRIWIEEGCICCQACVTTCPTVFAFPDDHAIVRGEAREDGISDHNRDRHAAVTADIAADLADQIAEAAEGCPVDIIRLER